MGQDRGLAYTVATKAYPCKTRWIGSILRLRKTTSRNGVTAFRSREQRAGVNRMRNASGIAEEANAWGNAQDMLTSARQDGR